MYINTDQMVSMTEANRSFSKVAKLVDEKKEIVIMKNNKPSYVMMDYEEYENQKFSNSKINEEQAEYYCSSVADHLVNVSEDGKIKLPENIKKILNVSKNGKVTIIEYDGKVELISPSVFALKKVQKAMEGKAEELGLKTIDDVVDLIKEVRREIWEENNADND